jgi:hypothetical protein
VTSHPLAIPLAWVFAVVMLLNGIAHITMMVVKWGYFPGGNTAFPILIISIISIVYLVGIP